MTVIVEELAIEYYKKGNGPVVLMIHGWGDSHNTFREQYKMLEKNFTVIGLDLPGFGKSDTPKTDYDLKDYAEIVNKFINKLGINEVKVLIGHSNGGAIIIKGLSSGLLSCERAILLASSGVRSEFNGRKKLVRLAVKTAKMPTKLLPKKTQKRIRSKVYKTLGSDMLIAENLQGTFKKIVSEDLTVESAMISNPVLLIYGTEDTATPLRYGELLNRQIENSKLVSVEGADHFLHQTHFEIINNIIESNILKK